MTAIACRSRSLDRYTQLVQVVDGASSAEWAGLEPCIAEAIASGRTRVVVDLSALGGVRPALLPALFRGQRWLGWRGGQLAVVSPEGSASSSVLNGLGSSIHVYPSSDAARGALGA